MSHATRPMASTQTPAPVGSIATLAEIHRRVQVVAHAVDLMTGKPFYVVRSDSTAPCFGVWPDELVP